MNCRLATFRSDRGNAGSVDTSFHVSQVQFYAFGTFIIMLPISSPLGYVGSQIAVLSIIIYQLSLVQVIFEVVMLGPPRPLSQGNGSRGRAAQREPSAEPAPQPGCVSKPPSQAGMTSESCSTAHTRVSGQRHAPMSSDGPELQCAKGPGNVLTKKSASSTGGRAVKKRPAAAKHDKRVDRNASAGRSSAVLHKKPAALVSDTASSTSGVQGAMCPSEQSASVPCLTPAIIKAIDSNLAKVFPQLPRPPSEEFYRLLRRILDQGDLRLGDGFRLAERHRRHGTPWPCPDCACLLCDV